MHWIKCQNSKTLNARTGHGPPNPSPAPAQLHRQGGHLPHLLDTVAGDSAAVAHLPPLTSTTGVDGYDTPLGPSTCPAPSLPPHFPLSRPLTSPPALYPPRPWPRHRHRRGQRPPWTAPSCLGDAQASSSSSSAGRRRRGTSPCRNQAKSLPPAAGRRRRISRRRRSSGLPEPAAAIPVSIRVAPPLPPSVLCLRPLLHRTRAPPPPELSPSWPPATFGRAFGTVRSAPCRGVHPARSRSSNVNGAPISPPPVGAAATARRRRLLRPP